MKTKKIEGSNYILYKNIETNVRHGLYNKYISYIICNFLFSIYVKQ